MKRALCVGLLLAVPAIAADAPALRILGDVRKEQSLSLAEIEALPAKTVKTSFHTMHGEQSHAWTGAALIDLLAIAGLENETGKNAQLRHSVLVHGKDGYIVAVAYGEVDPKAGNQEILVAYKRDGDALQGLQLVMPGDAGGARQMHDVVEMEVK